MSPKEARNYIYEAFITAWAAATEILFENQEEVPPEGSSPWVRISVQHNDGEQAALGGETGNQFFRRYGLVFVQVFVPRGEATNTLDDLCYNALKAFEGKQIQGIWFRNCRIATVSLQEEKWTQQNIVAEFQYDDVH